MFARTDKDESQKYKEQFNGMRCARDTIAF